MHGEYRERFSHQLLQRKALVSDPDTHVAWCLPGSPTRGGGENVTTFPAHAKPTILRIYQEAHNMHLEKLSTLAGWYEMSICLSSM